MEVIDRNIAGAFIVSADGKILLGNNKKGGVYQNMLVVPGGGIDSGETELDAVIREVHEEVGIDISGAIITELTGVPTGQR